MPLLRTFVYGVWGDALFFSAPPLDPFGVSGYGAYRGRWKHYTDLSSRDWRNAPKSKTGFELDRRPQHLCDSTVAPPLPFPVHALWICGRKWGGENGPAEHCIKGTLRVTRSSPKILGDLKTMMIKSYGGRRVSRLSPSIVMHALNACNAAKREAKRTPRRRRATRPKIDQEEKPQNQKNRGRGWVRIRDIKRPRIHTPPQPMPSVLSSQPTWG